MVSVAGLKPLLVTVPAPVSELIVWLLPLRSRIPLLLMETSELAERTWLPLTPSHLASRYDSTAARSAALRAPL